MGQDGALRPPRAPAGPGCPDLEPGGGSEVRKLRFPCAQASAEMGQRAPAGPQGCQCSLEEAPLGPGE